MDLPKTTSVDSVPWKNKGFRSCSTGLYHSTRLSKAPISITFRRSTMPPRYNRVSIEELLNRSEGSSSIPTGASSASNVGGEYKFLCQIDQCRRGFVSEEARRAHQARFHAPRTKYVCPNCKESYATKTNLNKHVRKLPHPNSVIKIS